MKKTLLAAALLSSACVAASALAKPAAAPAFSIKVGGIGDNKPINGKFAYCIGGRPHSRDGGNISPAISWSGAPAGTKSYALIVVDPDVPTRFDAANKEGQTIFADFPRRDFYHWVLVDIPPEVHGMLEGKDSHGITPGGKPTGHVEYGVNARNDYGHGGYDGPCPPWNDERLHHYHFIIYALDVDSLALPDAATGIQAKSAMEGHVLAQAETVGTYTTNPSVHYK